MDIFVLVGTIIAIIAGLAQILDTKNRKALTIIVGIILILFAAGFAANFFYFGPKAKGEHFLASFRNLNTGAMQADVCVDSPIYNQFGGLGGLLVNVASSFGTNRISNVSYNPVSKQFQFFYSLTSSLSNQDETQFATLQIKTVSLNEFCVSDIAGLDSSNNSSNSSLSSGSNSSSSNVQPVGNICYGWRLHLVETTQTDIGDGWITLSGNLIWENVNVSTQAYRATFSPYFDENIKAFKALKLTTDQGYEYSPDVFVDYWLGRHYVPPGYMYRLPPRDLSIKVSSATTGWKITTPCGVLDFAHPESVTFPSWDGLPSFGNAVSGVNGILTLNSFNNCGYPRGGNPDISDTVCAHFTFKNTDLGYEHEIPFRYLIMDHEGNVLNSDDGWAFEKTFEWAGRIGPGQTVNIIGASINPKFTQKGVLLFVQSSTVENNKTILGDAWPMVLVP